MARHELCPIPATDSRPDRTGTPCAPYQWLAIVAHLLRMPYRESPLPSGPLAPGLIIDRQSRESRIGSARIELTFREFELLDFLASNPGRVFTREQLLQRVWRRDRAEGSRTVDVHIHRLRGKLGARYGQRLVTVRRVGYKFAPPAGRASGREATSPPPGPFLAL